MTLGVSERDRILQALLEFRNNSTLSQAKFCARMQIHPSVFSSVKKAIKNGEATDRLISDDKLVFIGRMLGINFSNNNPWTLVRTPTFEYILASLQECQEACKSRIFCDIADIGKSETAKYWMRQGINVYYLDCSQYKSRNEFVRALATIVGVKSTGKMTEVFKDTCFMLNAVHKPLVILDEAGDLSYGAFLEIKAYWNATEGACAWFMMGADGLAEKITNNKDNKKVGYAEIFRRFGDGYLRVTTDKPADIAVFKRDQVLAVAETNLPVGVTLKSVTENCMSLTRLKENISKVERRSGELFDQQNEQAA